MPSSAQPIGDHSDSVCMPAGISVRGTMMPAMAPSTTLTPAAERRGVIESARVGRDQQGQADRRGAGGKHHQQEPAERQVQVQRIAAQPGHQPAADQQHERELHPVQRHEGQQLAAQDGAGATPKVREARQRAVVAFLDQHAGDRE